MSDKSYDGNANGSTSDSSTVETARQVARDLDPTPIGLNEYGRPERMEAAPTGLHGSQSTAAIARRMIESMAAAEELGLDRPLEKHLGDSFEYNSARFAEDANRASGEATFKPGAYGDAVVDEIVRRYKESKR